MPKTAYCYHCGIYHPIEEMRQVLTRGGKRWRCIKTIESSKRGRAEREAFGRQVTAGNKADTQAQLRRMTNPERNKD